MIGQPSHNTWPHARLPLSFLCTDAWMASQLWFASYLGRDVLGVSLTFYPWVFVQSCTSRRPVDKCRNYMSVLYIHALTLICSLYSSNQTTESKKAKRDVLTQSSGFAIKEAYSPLKAKIEDYRQYIENNRQHIFYLVLFFGVTIALFIERFLRKFVSYMLACINVT